MTQIDKVLADFKAGKFVIVTDIPSRDLKDYNGVHKSSESRESFFNEAKLQQYIWKESITFGRPAICPSVANLSMFTREDLHLDFRSC